MKTVSVQVGTSDGDAAEADRLARQFRQEVLGLDVETVAVPGAGAAPYGAKGDPASIGTLVVTLANSAVLASLCQLARAWVIRARGRRITIKDRDRALEIDGASTAQQQQLIDAFLAGTRADPD